MTSTFTPMTSREMFEKYFANGVGIHRLENGQYADPTMQIAWAAWRMSASLRHEGELE